jgi:hypothetical protein
MDQDNLARTQALTSAELKKAIADFETNLLSIFQMLLTNDVQLPLWGPLHGTEEFRRHITDLKIPLVSATPSLLLHNLGQQSHDTQLVGRIRNLFDPGSKER